MQLEHKHKELQINWNGQYAKILSIFFCDFTVRFHISMKAVREIDYNFLGEYTKRMKSTFWHCTFHIKTQCSHSSKG